MTQIFILLWILLLPLSVSVYQATTHKGFSLVPKQKKAISRRKREQIATVIIYMSVVIGSVWMAAAEETGSGKIAILLGEMVVFDFAVLAFYFKEEDNLLKKILVFLLAYANLWTSAYWAITEKLSPLVLWTCLLSYPIFGFKHVFSYCLQQREVDL